MTYADEFVADQQAPEATGPLGLSPVIIGAIIGVLGAAGAGFIVWSLILPTLEQMGTIETEIQDLEGQIQQQQAKLNGLAEAQAQLEEVEFRRQELMAFFPSGEVLDISLLDLERLVRNQNLTLKKFAPEGDIEEVTDSSLGAAVNGRFKRQKYVMTVEGDFSKTQAFFRDLEKYEPIIQVSNYKVISELPVQLFRFDLGGTVKFEPIETAIETELNLQVVVKLSDAELEEKAAAEAEAAAAAAAAAAPPAEAPPAEAPPP